MKKMINFVLLGTLISLHSIHTSQVETNHPVDSIYKSPEFVALHNEFQASLKLAQMEAGLKLGKHIEDVLRISGVVGYAGSCYLSFLAADPSLLHRPWHDFEGLQNLATVAVSTVLFNKAIGDYKSTNTVPIVTGLAALAIVGLRCLSLVHNARKVREKINITKIEKPSKRVVLGEDICFACHNSVETIGNSKDNSIWQLKCCGNVICSEDLNELLKSAGGADFTCPTCRHSLPLLLQKIKKNDKEITLDDGFVVINSIPIKN